MLPVLQLGGLALPMPPLALLLGLYIALDISQKQAVRRKLNGDRVYNIGFNSLVIGLLSARLAFVLANLNTYLQIRPVSRMLISFVTPLLGSEIGWVGLIVGIAAAAFFMRRHKISWVSALDAYAIGGSFFVITLWAAHLLSGDSYGVQTSLPWGINLWGASRHPTQIYSLIISTGVFWFLRRVEPAPDRSKKKKKKKSFQGGKGRFRPRAPYEGYVAILFVLLTSLTILLLEPLRADSPVIAGGIRVWQIGALVTLVIALGLLARQAPPRPQEDKTTATL